jgi:uncharacterized protein (TIGR02246 family)
MRNRKWIVAASCVLALGAALFVSRVSESEEDESMAVRRQCNAFVTAWNQHDARAMASVFAEDGDMLGPDGVRHSGRSAVEKALAKDHGESGAMRASTTRVLDEPVRFATDTIAVSDAEVVVSGVVGPDGTKSDLPLRVTNVWKKTDGRWLVFACRPHLKGPPPAPAGAGMAR